MRSRFLQRIMTAFDNFVEPESPICLSGKRSVPDRMDEIPEPEQKNAPHIIKFARREETEVKEYNVADFELAAGIIYLPEMEFRNEKTLQLIRKQCSRVLKKGIITPEIKWLGALHAQQIRSHYIADVSIRWINERLGYGLFAEKDIKAWEYIGKYAGVVRRLSMIYRNYNDYCFFYPTSDLYFRQHIIDGRNKGNELRYANHSDSPNCESRTAFCDGILHVIVRALQDIPANTQITYDYTVDFWQTRSPVPNVTEVEVVSS